MSNLRKWRHCHSATDEIDETIEPCRDRILAQSKKSKEGELTEQQKKSNRILSVIRTVVEYPFGVIKQPFGFTKVRYRGLKKNTGQIVTLFALFNLWMAQRRLIPTAGEVCS